MTDSFVYTPLKSDRHIRLIQILNEGDDDAGSASTPDYRIVQQQLPRNHTPLDFEAISYTWGNPERVSAISVEGEAGAIGLTKSLTEALPYLSKHSITKFLWIDQICINQNDNEEKAKQVAMMSQIYKRSWRVMVWLGLDDENTKIAKQWCEEVDKMIDGMENSDRMKPDSPTYNADIRNVVVRSTWVSEKTDPMYLPAIQKFWAAPWFTRGWIVQELLLARTTIVLCGDIQFSKQDLTDLVTLPGERSKPGDSPLNLHDNFDMTYRILMDIALYPFTDPQPLRFLRIMCHVTQEFQTFELRDKTLYAYLGMIPEVRFIPDYSVPITVELTRFFAALAEQLHSLDFLSLWSANLDPLVPSTPKELLGLPSWVPSLYWLPLTAPWRLAVGGVRNLRHEITWNAAKGRKHVHDQEEDAALTERLVVRGKIIDYVGAISSARFHRYFDADDEYLNGLVNQIKKDIPGVDHWVQEQMIEFLNVVSFNGVPPTQTFEDIMGLSEKSKMFQEVVNMAGYNEGLGLCLSMGRGRRFMRTEKGRLGLAPFIGTKAKNEREAKRGSPVVIVHGCSVPMLLECVSEERNEWNIVGDCYVEGIMHGEGVDWEEGEARSFVLV